MEYKEFITKTATTVKRANDLNKHSRKEGLAELIEAIDAQKLQNRDIFEFGIQLAADGAELEYIDTVLLNLIKTEQDDTARRLKIIKKEAIICIQKGLNSWLLLNSLFALMNNNERKDVQNILKDETTFAEFFNMYF